MTERSALRLAAVALSILLLASILSIDYLPTHDGPQHAFGAWVSGHLDDPATGWGRYLERDPKLTSRGFDEMFSAFALVGSWRPALRLTLAAMALGWAWACMALAAALAGDAPARRWLGLLGFASSLQWAFYMGFFPFYIASSLGLGVVALAVAPPPWRPARRVAIAAALLLQAMAHMFAAMLTGHVLVILGVLRAPRAGRARELAVVAAMGAPAAAVVFLVKPIDAYQSAYVYDLIERIPLVARCFVSGPAWRAWPIVVLALGGVVAGVRSRAFRDDATRRALLVAGGVLLLGAILAPVHLHNWQFFSSRFAPPAVMLLALCVPIERLRNRRAMAAAAAGLGLYAAASIAWGWQYHRRLVADGQDWLAALDLPIRRNGPRLSLVPHGQGGEFDETLSGVVPFATPHRNLGTLYGLAHGGVPADLWSGYAGAHTLAFKKGAGFPPGPRLGYHEYLGGHVGEPEVRRGVLTQLLGIGVRFDDIIFYGEPSDLPELASRGLAFDYQAHGLVIARFVGCVIDVTVDDRSAAGAPAVLIEAGSWPYQRAITSEELPPAAGIGTRRARLSKAPCGDVWVRVVFDVDGDGQPSRGDHLCDGVTPAGLLRLPVKPNHPETVTCRPGPTLP